MKLSSCSFCNVQLSRKNLIECEFVAKTWIKAEFVVKAWIKWIVVTKTFIKHELVAKASIFIAFGYEKNNPARRAGEKNNLAPILPEKFFPAQT